MYLHVDASVTFQCCLSGTAQCWGRRADWKLSFLQQYLETNKDRSGFKKRALIMICHHHVIETVLLLHFDPELTPNASGVFCEHEECGWCVRFAISVHWCNCFNLDGVPVKHTLLFSLRFP